MGKGNGDDEEDKKNRMNAEYATHFPFFPSAGNVWDVIYFP